MKSWNTCLGLISFEQSKVNNTRLWMTCYRSNIVNIQFQYWSNWSITLKLSSFYNLYIDCVCCLDITNGIFSNCPKLIAHNTWTRHGSSGGMPANNSSVSHQAINSSTVFKVSLFKYWGSDLPWSGAVLWAKVCYACDNTIGRCFYCLRQLRSIWRSPTVGKLKKLINPSTSIRFDYCNDVFKHIAAFHVLYSQYSTQPHVSSYTRGNMILSQLWSTMNCTSCR